jgi:hypothetical protein
MEQGCNVHRWKHVLQRAASRKRIAPSSLVSASGCLPPMSTNELVVSNLEGAAERTRHSRFSGAALEYD